MIVIVILAAALTTGTASAIVVVCRSIAQEERGRSLAERPASRSELMTRRIVGWHGDPPRIVPASHRQADFAGPRPLTLVSPR